ncbi:MAG: ornithine--oxo-acid transaminase [Deltaproteobacteria bacterium]|nr:ornithine--oxo-acid transaminase [Deltaproteobacteria bacterium]
MDARSIIEIADRYGAHNYHPLPVVLARGQGVWVEDVEGHRFMDMLSSYSALNQGHLHPRILEAAIAQMGRLTLTSRAFHNDRLGAFLERLCRLSGFDRALPMNTGAEAVETAIKAARKWGYKVKGVPEDQARIIVCTDNFHGRTVTIISFSTEDPYRDGFGPFTPGFTVVPYGDAEALEAAFDENTVAFLVEPIQGEAGIRIPPAGYLRRARELCDRYHALLVLDEIQTGLGRTGRMFCFEHEGIRPDGLTLGKALGGGLYPVSAFLSSDEVMGVFHPGDHGSTFGGNPLAAAVGIAALDVLVDEDLAGRAERMGRRFVEGLEAMSSPHVLEIRGKGLLIGVEIKPESGPARPFCERLMEAGILAKETHHQVIRFAPPLVISEDEVDWALARIAPVLVP